MSAWQEVEDELAPLFKGLDCRGVWVPFQGMPFRKRAWQADISPLTACEGNAGKGTVFDPHEAMGAGSECGTGL